MDWQYTSTNEDQEPRKSYYNVFAGYLKSYYL